LVTKELCSHIQSRSGTIRNSAIARTLEKLLFICPIPPGSFNVDATSCGVGGVPPDPVMSMKKPMTMAAPSRPIAQ
jgi:hypothetical protein